ncbi:MAG TPA: hypothetical protein DCP91_07175 [Eggerthellaceae bacterium]|nr:hypothetical protein [Eggerthellaceae bacterium]
MAEYLKLCESMNFTRAARELHLSQSALSKHVSQIEDELGAALILRSTHDAVLTPEGELVRERLESILGDFDRLVRDVGEMQAGMTGRLRVGFVYYGGMECMRPGLARFAEARPGVSLDLVSLQPHDIIERLRSGELDAGLLMEVPALASEGFPFVPVGSRKLAAIMAAGNPLVGEDAIDPASLEGARIAVLDADEEYNDAMRSFLANVGVSTWEEVRCPQIDLYPLAVADSDVVFPGTADMPVPADGSLVSVPVGDPPFTIPVGLHYRMDGASGALVAFVGALRSGQ